MAMIFPLSLKPSQEEICIVRPVQLFSKSSPFHSTALIFWIPIPFMFAYKKWYLWTETKNGAFGTKDGNKIKSCTYKNSAMKNSVCEWTSLLYSSISLCYSLCTQVLYTSGTFLLFFLNVCVMQKGRNMNLLKCCCFFIVTTYRICKFGPFYNFIF